MNAKDEWFSLRTLAEATGQPYRSIARWCGNGAGALIGVESEGEGRGRRVRLSLWDILELTLAVNLRRQGVSLQTIRKALRTLKERTPGSFDQLLLNQLSPESEESRTYLVVLRDGLGKVKDLAVRDLDRDQLVSLVRSAGQIFLTDVQLAVQQMKNALKEADERIKAQPRRPRYRGTGKDAVLMEV